MMKSMSYWKKRQRSHRLAMHTHAINVISVEKKRNDYSKINLCQSQFCKIR